MNDEEKAKMNDEKKEADKPTNLVMTIIREPNGRMGVSFPLINDKIVTYGFLRMAEKVPDSYYEKMVPKPPPKGGIAKFVRGVH